MKIGLSSASFYPNTNTEDSFEVMKSLGFSDGEIFLNSFCEYEKEFVDILLEKKVEYKFNIMSVHAFGSVFEPYLFDDYQRRRTDFRKVFKAVCKAGKALGAKYYTFHGIRLANLKEINRKFILDIYNELTYEASEIGITLSQENVSWCMSAMPEYLNILKEGCRYPLSFTLDIKQAYKAGMDPLSYIDIMGNSLGNIHINDKDGKNICLLPGKGNVDYHRLLKKLSGNSYNGDMIIEVYNSNYSSINELTEAKQYIKCISDLYF